MRKYILALLSLTFFVGCGPEPMDDYITIKRVENNTAKRIEIFYHPVINSYDTICTLSAGETKEISRTYHYEHEDTVYVGRVKEDTLVVFYDDTISINHYFSNENQGATRSLSDEKLWNLSREEKNSTYTFKFTEEDYQEALSLQK